MNWTKEQKVRVAHLIAATDKASRVSVVEFEMDVPYSAVESMIKKVKRGNDEELKALFPGRDREEVWTKALLARASELWRQKDPILPKSEIAQRLGVSRQALIGAIGRSRESSNPETQRLFPSRDKDEAAAAFMNRPGAPTPRPRTQPKPKVARERKKKPPAPIPVMATRWKVQIKRPSNVLDFAPPPVRPADPIETTMCSWPMHGAVDRYGRSIFPAYRKDARPGQSPLVCGEARAIGSSYCALHNTIAYSKDAA